MSNGYRIPDPAKPYLLVLDQGTTSTRALLYDSQARPVAQTQIELPQHFPEQGWVEHDADLIWQHSLQCMQRTLEKAEVPASKVAGLGITNQRETVVLWDRKSGQPLHKALVWQDRRTAKVCEELRSEGLEPQITAKTGLLLDPYFSASKLTWLLDEIPQARSLADDGKLAAGTIDSFLIAKLTGQEVHATDATNASRTLLFDIHQLHWDPELLNIFRIPDGLLPEVRNSIGDFGLIHAKHLGAEIPILAVAGDQQAAAYGQGCWSPGLIKSTYGTGCFTLLHCGETAPVSQNRLLTTVALMEKGKCTYALEGSIFNAGTAIQWLRDQLGFLTSAEQSEQLAMEANPKSQVLFIPAFTGMGAPYWNPHARGTLFGLTRDTTPADVVRAALEAVAWQTVDLIEATTVDHGESPKLIRVDGGMAKNNWFLQFLADVLQISVQRPKDTETTALGACLLAGKAAGFWSSEEEISSLWREDKTFHPSMEPSERLRRRSQWRLAVESVLKIADNLSGLA